MSSILAKVEAYCSKEGIPMYMLEKKAGIGNGTIGKWSTSTPSLQSLMKLSEVMGVPVSYFIDDVPSELSKFDG